MGSICLCACRATASRSEFAGRNRAPGFAIHNQFIGEIMRTAKINIYEFSELSPSAKDRAKQDYQSVWGFPHSEEYFESLKKLAEHFGAKLAGYEIDWFNCSYSSAKFSFSDEDMPRPEIRLRLAKLGTFNPTTRKGLGDCRLTGYCADEDAIDGFRIHFLDNPQAGLTDCMESAFRSWLTAGQDDCEGFYEDEYFAEHCQANEMEFYDDGSAA